MKLGTKAIDAYLAAPDQAQRAALLYGPDSGLAAERARRIIATVLAANDDPFALVELSEAALMSDPARLSDELAAFGLLGGKRLIWLRDAGDKAARIIEEAAAAFHADAFLLVTAGELSARSALRAWFEKEKLAAALACYKDEARDVLAVIRQCFEEAGIAAERGVTEYLSQQLGNDRGVTRQELEKLIAYAGEEKRLTLDDARALVDYNRDTELDDLVQSVADRNLGALEATLTRLLGEGAQPVSYLRALQRYFNRLYLLRGQMQGGRSASEVVESARPPVFFKAQPVLIRHLQSWGNEQIARALALLASAELACKTSDLPIVSASSRRLLQVTQIR